MGLTGYDNVLNGNGADAGGVRVLHIGSETLAGDIIKGEAKDDFFDHWLPVGGVMEAGSFGDHVGLKVSLSREGHVLAIGDRNYDVLNGNGANAGGVRVLHIGSEASNIEIE